LSKYSSNRYHYASIPRDDPDKMISDYIVKYADEHKADFMGIGYVGRKGMKEDSTLFGSNCAELIRNAPCSLFVAKYPVERKHGRKYLVGIDDSDKTLTALKIAVELHDPTTYDIVMMTHVTFVRDEQTTAKELEIK